MDSQHDTQQTTVEILTSLSILIQGSLAVLKPTALRDWNELSEDVKDAIRRRTSTYRDQVGSIDWYEIVTNDLQANGVRSEDELLNLFRTMYDQTKSRFRKKAVDFVIQVIGDLAVAHRAGKKASPALERLSVANFCISLLFSLTDDNADPVAVVRRMFRELPAGQDAAGEYEVLVFHLLNLLFTPDLAEGHLQVTTSDSIGRKDITFSNNANSGLWGTLRQSHGNVTICFEVKNKTGLDNDDINQISSRLSSHTGRCGFIVMRQAQKRDMERARHLLHKGEVIVVIQDDDLIEAASELEWRGTPDVPLMKRYREVIDEIV